MKDHPRSALTGREIVYSLPE